MKTTDGQDWASWSRESVALMEARNRTFVETFALSGRRFQWNLEAAQIAFVSPESAVVADLCVVGTISQSKGTFLWAWANDAIPRRAQERIHEARIFGETHDLGLLTTAEWPGGRAEAMEMLAVAGRILDADGVFVAPHGDLTFFFALHRFRTQPVGDLAWLTSQDSLTT